MKKEVADAFKKLQDEMLIAIGSDYVDDIETDVYVSMFNTINRLEEKYQNLFRMLRRNTNE